MDYEYSWRVDGVEVRNVVTAARSDVLPHHYAGAGNALEVVVTPSDGISYGDTEVFATTVDGEGLGGAVVWVDFAYTGLEYGTQTQPVDQITEAAILVSESGTVFIKGDTAINTSNESINITKPMRIEAANGAVTIGKS